MGADKKSGDGVRKVALLIETSNRYGRDLLYGVRDWMREGERWAIRFTEQARRGYEARDFEVAFDGTTKAQAILILVYADIDLLWILLEFSGRAPFQQVTALL